MCKVKVDRRCVSLGHYYSCYNKGWEGKRCKYRYQERVEIENLWIHKWVFVRMFILGCFKVLVRNQMETYIRCLSDDLFWSSTTDDTNTVDSSPLYTFSNSYQTNLSKVPSLYRLDPRLQIKSKLSYFLLNLIPIPSSFVFVVIKITTSFS